MSAIGGLRGRVALNLSSSHFGSDPTSRRQFACCALVGVTVERNRRWLNPWIAHYTIEVSSLPQCRMEARQVSLVEFEFDVPGFALSRCASSASVSTNGFAAHRRQPDPASEGRPESHSLAGAWLSSTNEKR